jgi:hypothetical protein
MAPRPQNIVDASGKIDPCYLVDDRRQKIQVVSGQVFNGELPSCVDHSQWRKRRIRF